ncbi:deoxyribodipyrimidine photo-lyase [Flavobacterium sp. MAH-1]|uniref:Deoxyribodipyrimidine photo-lyase n=1 Tax=Flavobacterium agri TaxID=2743471 RepID=A0A7Y8XZU2_9FLAO|nr:deoxyribodipyrimidine photo-lyase [Flavobacterium agri]NUY79762.1 deoxyribodipyrimidine photo-lyase [Flavobacterium agri]NYA69787.1 deoxyribodipyrimidine photo-lyase [Flavobacterium agri]
MNIFWFRRDLRLHDNCGFFHALSTNQQVLPVFIFDSNILEELPKDDHRITFIHQLLQQMDSELKKHDRKLAVFHGSPEDIFAKLIAEHKIENVFANHYYEPYATKRDEAIAKLFKKHDIGFATFKDQVIFEKSEIVKDNGEPYVVFTPYSKRWLEAFKKCSLPNFPSEKHLSKIANHHYKFLSLEYIGFETSKLDIFDYRLTPKIIKEYENNRNFPAIDGTSRVSPYLRFGALSIRKVVAKAAENNHTFLKELIWREFFMQILWHFPHTATKAFKPEYDRIKWRYAEKEFEKWREGKTGYPMVDAGMRELNQTGFMHNRVRMVVSSFLCKHLLLDWRWGEAYFAQKLFDFEQSSNVGNWQWAAGSGVDAAPYFRIFNPEEQLKKFDKDLKYVRKWIPEYDSFEYPEPIVDHKEARERCLKVYKEGLNR